MQHTCEKMQGSVSANLKQTRGHTEPERKSAAEFPDDVSRP